MSAAPPPTNVTVRLRMAKRDGRPTDTVITGKVTARKPRGRKGHPVVIVAGQEVHAGRIASWTYVKAAEVAA